METQQTKVLQEELQLVPKVHSWERLNPVVQKKLIELISQLFIQWYKNNDENSTGERNDRDE